MSKIWTDGSWAPIDMDASEGVRTTMDCFGYFDENLRECQHCWVARQCKSIRTTHTEDMEAALLEIMLAEMPQEGEISDNHPMMQLMKQVRFQEMSKPFKVVDVADLDPTTDPDDPRFIGPKKGPVTFVVGANLGNTKANASFALPRRVID